MASIADRVRKAASLDNSIEPVADAPRPAEEATVIAAEAPEARELPPRPKEMDSYYQEMAGAKMRYYEDYTRKSLAFTASNEAITTKKQDAKTIGIMTGYAASQGWTTIKVTGTQEFRREAWIEANMRGIDAKGYKPTDPDRQEARRRAAEQGFDVPENKVAKEAPAPAQVKEPAPPAAGPIAPAAPEGVKQAAPSAEPPAAGLKAVPGVELSPAGKARAAQVDDYLRAVEASIAGKGDYPPRDEKIEAGLKAVEREFIAQERSHSRFDVANEFRARDAKEFAAAEQAAKVDKREIREGMTAAEHRGVLRANRAELSDDGKIALAAFSAKIDKEMNLLNAEKKAELKAHAAVAIAAKERAEGPVTLSKEQRDQAKAPATPAQERENSKDHLDNLKVHMAGAKREVSSRVISRYDQVALKLDQTQPKPAPAQKASEPKHEAPAQPKQKRSRAMSR